MEALGADDPIQSSVSDAEVDPMEAVSQVVIEPTTCCGNYRGVRVEVIAEAMPDIVWVAGPDGSTWYLNSHVERYTGVPNEGNYGWDWTGIIHPDDVPEAQRAWIEAVHNKREHIGEFRLRRFDGVFRWHRSHARPLLNPDGSVKVWFGTAIDIEDHKRMERSLLDSQHAAAATFELLRSIEEVAPIGFKLLDRDFKVVHINERLARVHGLSAEECTGRSIRDLVPQLFPGLDPVYERAFRGETVTGIEVTTEDIDRPGQVLHWLASYYPVRLDGEIIAAGNVVVDVTKQVEASQALRRNVDAMVSTIAATVEYRDPYTAGHQRRVAALAAIIAQEMGLDEDTVEGIRVAANIHDLGKIAIPAEILSKPGRLTNLEYQFIKQHAQAGYDIVSAIEFPWPVAEMICQHHERLDGSGYPHGLKGEEILVGARVIAVADVVEAMTSHRPYRPGRGLARALEQITVDRGTLLDPDVVDACYRAAQSGRVEPIVDPR